MGSKGLIKITSKLLFILGLLAYFGFLVLQLPITRILAWIEPLPEQVRVYGAEGTAFTGSATVVQWNDWRLESVTWEFRPLALVMGRLEFDVTFHNLDESKGHARAGITMLRQPYLADLHAHLRVSALEPLWRPTVMNFGGWLGIDFDHIKKAITGPELMGQVNLENVAWEGKPPIPIGDFLIALETLDTIEETQKSNSTVSQKDAAKGEIKGKKESKGGIKGNTENASELASRNSNKAGRFHRIVRGKITDRSGPIQVQGQFWLDPQGVWQITCTLTPRPNSPPQIRQVLSFLGQSDQEGRFSASFAGQLGEH